MKNCVDRRDRPGEYLPMQIYDKHFNYVNTANNRSRRSSATCFGASFLHIYLQIYDFMREMFFFSIAACGGFRVILLLSVLAAGSRLCGGDANREVKRILMVDSHSSADVWTVELGRGFRSSLNRTRLRVNCEKYELGVRYQPGIAPAGADVEALRRKLAATRYDLVVTTNNAAANLFFDGILTLPPGTPLLASSYHGELTPELQKKFNMTGVETKRNLLDNLRYGLRLLPAGVPVVIVVGASADGDNLPMDFVKRSFPPDAQARIRVLRGDSLSTEEMLRELAAWPKESLMLFHSWSSAKEEYPENGYTILPRIRRIFPGVVFSKFDSYIGHGAAGGIVVCGLEQGGQAGDLAVRILNGVPAGSIPVLRSGDKALFDYAALRESGLDPAALPAGTEFVNEPPDFISAHRTELVSGMALLVAVLLFYIAALHYRKLTQRKLEAMFSNLPQRILVVDTAGNVLYSHVPDSREPSMPTRFRKIGELPEQVRDVFVSAVDEAFRGGRKIEIDYQLSDRCRHAEFIPMPESNPFRTRVVMVISGDVTELHNSRLAVEQLAERFRLTLESIGDGVIATDNEERITLINPVAAGLTGFTDRDAVGRKLDEVFRIAGSSDGAPVESPLRKALETGAIVQLANHTDLISRTGERRNIADSAAPIRNPEDGSIAGGVLVFRDVTEDYRTLDRLRANSVILKSVAKIAKILYFRHGENGVLEASGDPEQFWPFRDGRPLSPGEWISPGELPEFLEAWRKLKSGESSELQLVYSAGTGKRRRYFEMLAEESVNPLNSRREFCGVIQDITHARENEMRYRDNLKLLETIMDNLPGYVFVKNADDNFRYILGNRIFAGMLGVDSKEIPGRFDHEIFPMDRAAAKKFREDDARLVASGEQFDCQEVFRNVRGREFIVRTIKNAIVRSDGTRLLIGMGIDVSRQYELEQEQTRTIDTLNNYINCERIINRSLAKITLENDFDAAVQSMLDIIGEQSGADRCYVFRYADGSYEYSDNIYEWVRDGIEPQIANLQHSDMTDTPGWTRLLQNREEIVISDLDHPPAGLESEAAFLKRQQIRSLLVSGIWIDNKLWGFVGLDFVRSRKDFSDCDIHTVRSIVNLFLLTRERFQQLERIADSVSLQRQIVDNIAIPIVILNLDCTIVTANPSIQDLTELSPEQLVGRKCHDVICRNPEPPPWCPMRETLRDGRMHHVEAEYNHRRFDVTSQPIFDRHGKMIYVLKSEVDITDLVLQKQELQAAMEQAQAANRAKSFFLATVSHELRTPLNAVIGFSELLQTGSVEPAEQREYLRSINFAGTALLNLINDVLDLSKLEAEQMNMLEARTDVASLVAETTSVFRLKAQEKDLFLKVDCSHVRFLLSLDRQRLRQVILNLVGNAIKFTPAGGVSVHAEFVPDGAAGTGTLLIRVADTGIGISPENIGKVFDPFVQDDTTRGARIYEGSGLGLAISRRLVDKMGGRIELASVPGSGTTFTVRIDNLKYELPAADTAEPPSAAPAPLPAATACRRVLLVDDVALNLKVLEAMLKKLDISAACAGSGEEALRLLRDTPRFDAVLTDLWMPGMNGFELARRIAESADWRSIPVVAVTADTQVLAGKTGVFRDILLKPITRESLHKMFEHILTGREMSR